MQFLCLAIMNIMANEYIFYELYPVRFVASVAASQTSQAEKLDTPPLPSSQAH